MELFTITIQIAGTEQEVSAESAHRGVLVTTSSGPVHVGDLHAAIDIAGRILGRPLERAGRNGAPWGLHVAAFGYQAVYGAWPLLPGVPGDPKETPISRLRARYRAEDGPLAALANAIRIIEALAPAMRRAA
jgi:hypothetical protein